MKKIYKNIDMVVYSIKETDRISYYTYPVKNATHKKITPRSNDAGCCHVAAAVLLMLLPATFDKRREHLTVYPSNLNSCGRLVPQADFEGSNKK